MLTPRCSSVAALLALSILPAAAQQISVHFDPAKTKVSFTLSDVLHTVHGSFRLRNGDMQFDAATGKASGQLVVDATTGDSGSGARDSRMHRNILESNKYPDIVFTPDHVDGKVNLDGDSKVEVHGMFAIHGGTHELTLPAAVHVSHDQVTVDTRFSVPYQKWGMKNPSTLFLRVGDQVQIEIQAKGRITTSS